MNGYNAFVARVKTTYDLDPKVVRAMRTRAARTGKRDSEVVEDALREYLGLALIERVRQRSNLSEHHAVALAYQELNAARRRAART